MMARRAEQRPSRGRDAALLAAGALLGAAGCLLALRPAALLGRQQRGMAVTYLGAEESARLDADLMGPEGGFTLEQLMELAGLSCACAIAKEYPDRSRAVLVVAGPGNNGGDGLVLARHLHMFGYGVTVVYPKEPKKDHYKKLVLQLQQHRIQIVDKLPATAELQAGYGLLVDAIFGFSFSGAMREPYASIVAAMKASKVPVASIDIPSGWDVEKGNVAGDGLEPALLVSLTTPKECARTFTGAHYLGGRFLPPTFAEKYKISLPPYPEVEQCVRLPKPSAL